ncbi:hypothetical protein ACFLR1_06360 [Bacteroidota bacterium]
MPEARDILLTFDYELGLGKLSGTVNNCLIKPTEALRTVLLKHGCKAVFFVDTTYLMRLTEVASENAYAEQDLRLIKEQIVQLCLDGHFIFHHIHPHWLDAIYIPEINQWDLSDQRRFALSSVEEETIDMLLHKSSMILNDWLKPTDPNYEPKGFRAGGLYIQPFENIKPSLIRNNISLDFSVLKGARGKGNVGNCEFDFSNHPEPDIYRFDDNVLKQHDCGEFIEISMRQVELKNICKIINGLHYRIFGAHKGYQKYGDGLSTNNKLDSKLGTSRFRVSETISIELLNPVRLFAYLKFVSRNRFTHFISHPKLFSELSIYYLDKFLYKVSRKYKLNTDLNSVLDKYVGDESGYE